MSEVVLDASAVLAYVNSEPGRSEVSRILPAAAISSINLSETIAKLLDGGADEVVVLETVARLNLEIVPFDKEQAAAAARLRPRTRHLGLSLGDRACLGLAQKLALPAYTADKIWSRLSIGITIIAIR